MAIIFDRLSRSCFLLAVSLAVVAGGRLSAGTGADTGVAAGNCDNTCSLGKVGDANPCITSATGTCVPTAGSPAATVCTGCAFAPGTDQTGKVVGCTMSCRGLTNKIEE